MADSQSSSASLPSHTLALSCLKARDPEHLFLLVIHTCRHVWSKADFHVLFVVLTLVDSGSASRCLGTLTAGPHELMALKF